MSSTLNSTRSSATAAIARDADDANFKCSRPLKVIRCCANQRGIYDFLLALNSNLTSMFNRSWDIMPSLHIHNPPLFHVELEKRRLGVGGHALVPGCIEHWTVQPWTYIRANMQRMITMHTRPRRTDRRTNIMAIARRLVLTNASRANKVCRSGHSKVRAGRGHADTHATENITTPTDEFAVLQTTVLWGYKQTVDDSCHACVIEGHVVAKRSV